MALGATDDNPGHVAHARDELVHEPRSAHAERAGDDDAGRLTFGGALERRPQNRQFAFTPDERHAPEDSGGLVDTERVAEGLEQPESERSVHPDNVLNELTGEEWLYFTKSLWTTAYPSEVGHAARKTHGANKPPRLMARLIEFFTKPGELVLDPFAGVGGTLLGAAICHGRRRALGFEIEQRWADVFDFVVAQESGRVLEDLGSSDPGGPRTFDATDCQLVVGDALELLRGVESGSVDFVATDPPYNPQLKLTMAGGRLAAEHANRRTDYAMVTTDPRDLANSGSYDEFLSRMEAVFVELRRVLRDGRYACVIVRDAYQDGRYRFTGSDLAARAEKVGFVTKGDLIWYQAGTRLRPYGYPRSFVPNIVHQHILVLRAG
jgi:DNA modification methylase